MTEAMLFAQAVERHTAAVERQTAVTERLLAQLETQGSAGKPPAPPRVAVFASPGGEDPLGHARRRLLEEYDKPFYWTSEAAKVFKCNPDTIVGWIGKGKFKSATRESDGGPWQLDKKEVHALAAHYRPRGRRRRKPDGGDAQNGQNGPAH
jgi:hypothetical protein